MQMAVVQVVYMAVMLDTGMATVLAVNVAMPRMSAVAHGLPPVPFVTIRPSDIERSGRSS